MPRLIVTTSWDDGHPEDARLADLLEEFGLRGTFYVAPQNRERPVMGAPALRELAQRFEIGGHTMTHPPLTALAEDELRAEVQDGKRALEDILGSEVAMFCYPRGRHSRRVRRAVAAAGFRGARTTLEFITAPPPDPWRMPTTLQAYPHGTWTRLRHGVRVGNWRGLARLLRAGAGTDWTELALAFFRRALSQGGVWHLWGHSWELSEHGLWDDLRAVLGEVARRPDAEYLTNGQIVCEPEPALRADPAAGVNEGRAR
jgi:peptidoglycan/xylan/chitin deacetylase (PgdA/CDA1 family)